MSITVIYRWKESKHKFSISRSNLILACVIAIAVLITGAWSLQYYYHQQLIKEKITSLKQREAVKQQYLDSIESYKSQQLNVLAEKIGQLEIQNIHLNSLGEQLIEKSAFPREEFKFDLPPDQAPENPSVSDNEQQVKPQVEENTLDTPEEADPQSKGDNAAQITSSEKEVTAKVAVSNTASQVEVQPDNRVPQTQQVKVTHDATANHNSFDHQPSTDLVNSSFTLIDNKISTLASQFNTTENILEQLEITYNSLHLINELYISGRPVPMEGSRLSSPYGVRTDPFTGKSRFHKGVDIAGHKGMPILATAAGVVITSEARPGYGYVIVVNHGNGLMTRYAHALSLIASVGEVVEKGQQIAVMGTTGRSTGPHVHYEVLKNGTQVNPINYINRSAS
ncbi:M23 family metallopeptidase [Psychromonas aquatilis]|uniref:M23 family metallopeptidase n=1 Tax=Psychromonas aquatilis TaxID=2005072 RepID=A0ABU9GQ29_9GAMM